MNWAIFRSVMIHCCQICLIHLKKGLTWLQRIWLCRLTFLRSYWLLRLFSWRSSRRLFLFILLFLELHSHLFRRLFKFLFLLLCITIEFSFGDRFFLSCTTIIWSCWRFRFLLFNFWRFLFGSRLRLFLVWRLRFLLLLGLLFTSFLTLVFRLGVLIACDKFASKPDKEIVYVEPFRAFLRLSKHRVWRIRHLRSKISCIIVTISSTLRKLSVGAHIHLIIKSLLRW